MVHSRGSHKVERVQIKFVPTTDEQSFRNVPSTFSPSSRTYSWRKMQQMDYLIVPKKISNHEIVVEMFIDAKKGMSTGSLQKVVENLIKSKVQSEWHGLRLASISKPSSAAPPGQRFVRGTIEEILGTRLER